MFEKNTINFDFRYPPLVNLIKLELCNEKKVLAKEYLSIEDICNYRDEKITHFDPSYGPAFIDMYTKPNNCRNHGFDQNKSTDLEQSSYAPLNGENSYYVARLFISISTRKVNITSSLVINEIHGVQTPIENEYPKIENPMNFIGFCSIKEVNMIDRNFKNGIFKFQFCFGNFLKEFFVKMLYFLMK